MSKLKPVTNEQIRKIALSNGFKLKTQPHGGEGLNPYVYNFAQALLEQAIPEGYALVPVEQEDIIKALQKKISAIYSEAYAADDEDLMGDALHSIVCICESS